MTMPATIPATSGVQSTGGTVGQHRPSQATELVRLITGCAEFFHSPDMTAHARIDLGDHHETLPLRTPAFRRMINRLYYEHYQRAPSAQATMDAVGVLEGRAMYDGEEHPVFVRLGERNGSFYLDLGDRLWTAVKINSDGWRIVNSPLLRFCRPRGMAPLPRPIPGGSLQELRWLVNVGSEEDWILLVAWLVAALCPHGPYPALILHGEQGSAKSTIARMLKSLVDPNAAPLRSDPRDVRDLMIAAKNGWVLGYDNISYLHGWLSDALCRLSTGGGFATRELYSDAEEVIFQAQRPVILNGIEEIATRADLLDRAIIMELPPIPAARRLPETAFWKKFEAARPLILGALLDVVSGAMRTRPGITLKTLPRMADFALLATAAEKHLGWSNGSFLNAYTGNRASANNLALDASPIASPLRSLAKKGWTGTASDLLSRLNLRAGDAMRQKGSPRSVRALSGTLRRLTPNLRAVGVEVSFDREAHTGRRMITLKQAAISASPSSPKHVPKKKAVK